MRFPALFVATTLMTVFAASAAAAPDARLQGAYKFNEGGWTYVHLHGAPEKVGFQHGYLLAREIEDNAPGLPGWKRHSAKRGGLSRRRKERAITSTPNTSQELASIR